MTPRIAVVMAAKNYARFLPQAVDSVLAQTFTDWELLIVDDGSTDATRQVVKPYLKDSRIRYAQSDQLGQSRAKNLGVRLTTAPLVAFLDADDAWMPTKLAEQFAVLESCPQVGVCYTSRLLIDDAGRRTPMNPQSVPKAYSGKVRAEMFTKNFVCFSSVMVRRLVFDHVGGFDENLDLAIDYDFWLRVAKHYEFQSIPAPLVLYRTGHGNLSAKLSDRVLTADVIMTRSLDHHDLATEVDCKTIGEGYASTYRSLAFTLRRAEPRMAIHWYLRAFRHANRLIALKGIFGTLRDCLRHGMLASTGPNASVNR
jgi:glycosyltransferase involved in cell wall biosynthesis